MSRPGDWLVQAKCDCGWSGDLHTGSEEESVETVRAGAREALAHANGVVSGQPDPHQPFLDVSRSVPFGYLDLLAR